MSESHAVVSSQPLPKLSYSVPELSEATGICHDIIWRGIHSGRLRAKKNGRKFVILHDAAMKWLAGLPDA